MQQIEVYVVLDALRTKTNYIKQGSDWPYIEDRDLVLRDLLCQIDRDAKHWLWIGNRSGKVQVSQKSDTKKRQQTVTRILYMALVGPLWSSQLRRKCDALTCVNPYHYKPIE